MIVSISGMPVSVKLAKPGEIRTEYEEELNKVCISRTCLKRPLSKRAKIGFQDQLSLNAGQKYCRMLQIEHSAILTTFVKL